MCTKPAKFFIIVWPVEGLHISKNAANVIIRVRMFEPPLGSKQTSESSTLTSPRIKGHSNIYARDNRR